MELLTVCIVVLLVCMLVFFKMKRTARTALGKELPGPSLLQGFKVFIQGSWRGKLHLYLTDLAKKHGPLFQIDVLLRKVLIVNDADTFRRLVKNPDLRAYTNNRPPTFITNLLFHGNIDIIFADYGAEHTKKRKIFHQILNFYGEGRNSFEELMIKTLEELTDDLRTEHAIEISACLKKYILHLVGFLISGDISEKGKANTEIIGHLTNIVNQLFMFENETVLQAFPFLASVPGLKFETLKKDVLQAYNQVVEIYFHQMKRTFDPCIKRGMVDNLLAIQNEVPNKDSFLGDDQTVIAIIADIITAAYITTSSSLISLFLYLIKDQHMQQRIYEEIQSVVGNDIPSFQHKQLMPYTSAVILEVTRISSTAPILLPHIINKDITFDGYAIPKSTFILMNAWFNHHREDFWEDPFAFQPERFLDSKGHLLDPNHPIRLKLVAFGTGPRSCPGEMFAKSRMFLVTVFLLQKFQFLSDDHEVLPSAYPTEWPGGAVVCPQDFKCKITPRQTTS